MTDVSFAYKEQLEEELISRLAEIKGLSLAKAMDVYYCSSLSQQISDGAFGIEYLSAEFLVEDLLENEPELFA